MDKVLGMSRLKQYVELLCNPLETTDLHPNEALPSRRLFGDSSLVQRSLITGSYHRTERLAYQPRSSRSATRMVWQTRTYRLPQAWKGGFGGV